MAGSSSKTGLLLGLLAVAGLAAFLVIAKPFGPKGDATLGDGESAEAPGALGVDASKAAAAPEKIDTGLASAFDAVGVGDVTVRLLTYRDRKPLVGQPVKLVNSKGDRLERATGDAGRVTFGKVRAGRDWVLSVEGKGFSPVEMRGVAVKARATTDLQDLLLGEAAVLHGKVVDGKGVAIAGASVSAYVGGALDMSSGFIVALTQSALTFPTATEETKTDDQGLFALGTLTPGASYELKTKRSGYAFSVQSNLVVTPEKSSGQLTIVLQPSATLKGKVVDEEGRAVANAMVIALEDQGMGGFGRGGAGLGTMKKDYTRSAADGTYVLDTLNRNQAYRFGVSATGRSPLFDSQPTTMDTDLARDFTLVKGGTLAGVVTDSTTNAPIEGARVVAIVGNMQNMGPRGGRGGSGGGGGGGATPAPSADSAASTQTAITAADGSFKLEGLRPGTVALGQVRAAGYADVMASSFMGQTGWGEVKAGETTNVEVKLDPGASVTGKVIAVGPDGSKAPVAGAQVAVLTMMAGFSGYPTAVSGEDGSFRVDGVRPGQVSIVASAPRYVVPNPTDEASLLTVPASGGIVEKDIFLSSAGAVEGVVTNSKGVPVPGARVRATASVGMFGGGRGGGRGGMGGMGNIVRMLMPNGTGGTVLSDAEGRYRVETVAADEKMIVIADSDEYVSSESEPFTVKAGETAREDLVMQGGGTIRGRVIDDHGAIVGSAKLRIGHVDPDTDALKDLSGFRADALLEPRFVSSAADGTFEISKVKPGRTLMKVEHDGYVVYYRRDLSIQPDQVMDNYVVTMTKGETISGVVKGDDGKVLAGAFVAVTKQANPTRMGGGGGAAAAPATPAPATNEDGSVEPSMSDRTDEQGRFTVENIPPGSAYTVLVWFAPGYKGYGQGEDPKAIVRGIATGARDVEFTLTKQEAGQGFPGFPGAGTGGPRPVVPVPTPNPGMGGGTGTGTTPTIPGGGMLPGGTPVPPGMGG